MPSDPLANGSHSVSARAGDRSGNLSEPLTWSFKVRDETPPVIAQRSPCWAPRSWGDADRVRTIERRLVSGRDPGLCLRPSQVIQRFGLTKRAVRDQDRWRRAPPADARWARRTAPRLVAERSADRVQQRGPPARPRASASLALDGGGERCESRARFEATRPVCSPKASMSAKPNWHDARALMLIDQALEQGTLRRSWSPRTKALAAGRQADPTHRSATSRQTNHRR
jgi:hypothetical protein